MAYWKSGTQGPIPDFAKPVSDYPISDFAKPLRLGRNSKDVGIMLFVRDISFRLLKP